MKPIDLTPDEQADPYLATAIVDHDLAWAAVIDHQEEARDKWQTMTKREVDSLLSRQQASLDRYKEARSILQKRRVLAPVRRRKVAIAAESGAIEGSSCASAHPATGSGVRTPPTNDGPQTEPPPSPDAPAS